MTRNSRSNWPDARSEAFPQSFVYALRRWEIEAANPTASERASKVKTTVVENREARVELDERATGPAGETYDNRRVLRAFLPTGCWKSPDWRLGRQVNRLAQRVTASSGRSFATWRASRSRGHIPHVWDCDTTSLDRWACNPEYGDERVWASVAHMSNSSLFGCGCCCLVKFPTSPTFTLRLDSYNKTCVALR